MSGWHSPYPNGYFGEGFSVLWRQMYVWADIQIVRLAIMVVHLVFCFAIGSVQSQWQSKRQAQ